MEKPKELPELLLLNPVPVFTRFEDRFFQRFQILKAYDSELPLHQFLGTHARSAVALLCYGRGHPISAEILRLLPALRVVACASAGVNFIDVSECRRRGIIITTAGDVFSADVADMAVGLLIDVLRKMSAADRWVRNRNWATTLADFPLGSKVGGKRVGIVGLGRIGSEVAKRLEALGCKISYNSRKKKESVSYPFYTDLRELANDSDVLVVCCGLTDQTRHIIDGKVLSALGNEGILVNVGRGAVVNEKEMVQCLLKGEIGGAGLDVFEDDPNVPNQLLPLDNVVLSPHNAVFTPESFDDLCQLIIGNLEAFFFDKPLLTEFLGE